MRKSGHVFYVIDEDGVSNEERVLLPFRIFTLLVFKTLKAKVDIEHHS